MSEAPQGKRENSSISVHLDDSDSVVAGCCVKGHIVIECIDSEELKSLQIQIQGEERVATRHSSFSSSNLFLLLNPSINFNPNLQEGTNLFSFEAEMPANLCPSSLRKQTVNGRTGSIEYSLIGLAETTSQQLESKKISFEVLEVFASRLHPVSCEDTLNGRIGGNATATASIHLTQQTFAIGNSAEVTLKIRSNKEVPHVTLSLSKTISLKEGENTHQATQQVARSVHPIKHAANSTQDRVCKLMIPSTTEPSSYGTRANLQYNICATFHIASLIPQELEVSIPIVLCHPKVFAMIPEENQEKLLQEEFSVPTKAGEENTDIQGVRILPKTPVRGETFYKIPQILYCDVPDDSFASLTLRVHSNKKVSVRGRLGEVPGMFSSDVQAQELSIGKYLLNIDDHSSPSLSAGRWYFAITGSSFMQSSQYQVMVTLTPKNIENKDPNATESVEEIYYEHQRRTSPFGTYSIASMDYPIWTDRTGVRIGCKDDASLPDSNWYWKTPWEYAASKVDRDSEGWQYASTWNATNWKNQSRAIHFVRRRIWKRTRAIKPPGYVDSFMEEDLDQILDEFELIPSNKPPGVIYIHPDDDSEESSNCTNPQPQESMDERKNEAKEENLISASEAFPLSLEDDSIDCNIDESSESIASLALDSSGGGIVIEFHAEEEESENDQESSSQFTMEDVLKANELAKKDLEEDEAKIMESQVILEQERKEKERRDREEAEFQRLEAERLERVSQLQKKREEEQRQMEEQWKQREEEVRMQLEQDQKRLMLLQGNLPDETPIQEEVKTEEKSSKPPQVDETSPMTKQQNSFQFLVLDDDDDDDDEIFEIVTDSDDEI